MKHHAIIGFYAPPNFSRLTRETAMREKTLIIPCLVIRAFSFVFVPERGGGMEFFMDINMLATIICLVIGVILLIIEIIVPGITVTGILGALALFAAVLLQLGNPLGIVFMAAIVLFILAVATIVFAYLASKGKLSKNRLVLNEQIDGASTNTRDEETGAREGLLGVSKTPLRPAGIAEFDGVIIDVSTAGEFLSAGANIIIKKVEGLRVLVQAVSDEHLAQ